MDNVSLGSRKLSDLYLIIIVLLYNHQWNTRWAFARKHDISTRENNLSLSSAITTFQQVIHTKTKNQLRNNHKNQESTEK